MKKTDTILVRRQHLLTPAFRELFPPKQNYVTLYSSILILGLDRPAKLKLFFSSTA